MVSIAELLPKVTVPGPEVFDQVTVTAAGGLGRPSSETVPSSVTLAGRVIEVSAPAPTIGATLMSLGLSAGPVPEGV